MNIRLSVLKKIFICYLLILLITGLVVSPVGHIIYEVPPTAPVFAKAENSGELSSSRSLPAGSQKEFAKRVFDLTLVGVLLPVLAPMFVGFGAVIFMEQALSGNLAPVIITETRISRGETFEILKLNIFREDARKKYLNESVEYKEQGTYTFLQREKGSLSHVGSFMKKYYLDELGQILNVLAGDMTLVGPRPLPVVFEANTNPPRNLLKTGVFGFPANHSKSRGDTRLTLSTDEQYLELYQWSSARQLIGLDIRIIQDGVRAILKGYG